MLGDEVDRLMRRDALTEEGEEQEREERDEGDERPGISAGHYRYILGELRSGSFQRWGILDRGIERARARDRA